ncbi:protoporphyrinogen/coproporphyrinogen oxidase [Microbacterium paulum]
MSGTTTAPDAITVPRVATDADVVVVGGGMSGLTVAHDLARAGLRVIVCEASDAVGGLLRRGRVGGIDLDLGAESFATRTDAVPALVADAGLGLELVSPRPGGAHLAVAAPAAAPGGAAHIVRAPLPRRTVLGIPADPLAADVVALIGADAAARAAAERDLPPLDLDAVEPSLFDLVADRSGRVVAERLVDTLCRSVYSRPATDVTLSELHPVLWAAARAEGSLIAGADTIATGARAGAAVGGIAGGMWRLPVALAEAAQAHGADIRTGVTVHGIGRGVADAGDAAITVLQTSAAVITARAVVIATGPAVAARLLGVDTGATANTEATDDTGATAPARVHVIAAAIDHTGLDAFPVGSGVIVDPALPTRAKALTHVTAKWAWAQAAAPAGRHLVRLSARDADAAGLETPADIAREVSQLTGLDIAPADVVDIVRQEWTDAVASARTAALLAAADRSPVDPAVRLAGASVAGTGLASVVPHARALAAALIADLAAGPVAAAPVATDTRSASHPQRSHA